MRQVLSRRSSRRALAGLGPCCHHRGVKRFIVALAVLGGVSLSLAEAHADPTPEPSPYQIQGPNGPVYRGMRTLPPICGVQPRACARNWDPNSGAWGFPPG